MSRITEVFQRRRQRIELNTEYSDPGCSCIRINGYGPHPVMTIGKMRGDL